MRTEKSLFLEIARAFLLPEEVRLTTVRNAMPSGRISHASYSIWKIVALIARPIPQKVIVVAFIRYSAICGPVCFFVESSQLVWLIYARFRKGSRLLEESQTWMAK
jgi:hypothetical protein